MVNVTNFEKWKKICPWIISELNKGGTSITSLNIEENIFILHSGFLTKHYANVNVILSPTKIQKSAFLDARKTKFKIYIFEYI